MCNINILKTEIKKIEDLERFSAVWKKLEQGNEMTIFQSYEWNKLLFEEEKNRVLNKFLVSIYIIQAFDNNEIRCLLPLIVQKYSNKTKWFGRKKGLYILGHDSWSDYLNLIYDDIAPECFDRIINFLTEEFKGYLFYITDIREDTKFAFYLERTKAIIDKIDVAVEVEKLDSVKEYEKCLSKHVRQNLRTAKNRMEKDGVEYKLSVCGSITDEKLIDQLVEIHINRMAEKNNVTTDLLHKVSSYIRIKYRTRCEHKNNIISQSMRSMKESCLVIAYLNHEIAGFLYGLQDNNTIRIMQNCVKTKFKYYSPLFRGAYDFILMQYENNKIKCIDFTRGNEKYKYDLGGKERKLKSFHIRL